MRTWVPSLASHSGLRIWRCCEPWCWSQMWLGSRVAVAVAAALIQPQAWEPPQVAGVARKDQKKKNEKSRTPASSFRPSPAPHAPGKSSVPGAERQTGCLPCLPSESPSRLQSCWKDPRHLCPSCPVSPGPRRHPAAARSRPWRRLFCGPRPRPSGGLGLVIRQTPGACKP